MNKIEFQIERLILHIGNRLNNVRTHDLKKHDLTSVQSETLLFFCENPGTTVTDLKEHLQISHQAARNIVERLKVKNFLYTSISDEDARANKVFLTSDGEKMALALMFAGDNVGSMLMTGFSEREKEELLRLLKKTANNFD